MVLGGRAFLAFVLTHRIRRIFHLDPPKKMGSNHELNQYLYGSEDYLCLSI